ncbi:hypothetical protein [Acidithiobacillus ferrivorans]|uniref:hypothetical protein n=1 Tax=Acidithiobacillus ferrivorans TaxID=160808 RepID=UPI001C06FA84|nr:hypothetical protein [Acidithiobacillus ferrivorans]MBU2849944.1 hypothetical protein [Acidithiobacillus ferrivorans]
MHIELAWWDLDENDPDTAALTSILTRQVRDEWEQVPNLMVKLWLVSGDSPRWGALMIWESDKPERLKLPSNISAKMIGRQPDHRIAFDVLHETRRAR